MKRTHIIVATGESVTLKELYSRLKKRTAIYVAHVIPGTARLSQDPQGGRNIRSRVVGSNGRILYKEWWLA